MKNSDEHFLSNVVLGANDWRGVGELANALSKFEPLAKRANLGPIVADRLVLQGLAEKGFSQRYGGQEGYRLTTFGWKVHERGRFPR